MSTYFPCGTIFFNANWKLSLRYIENQIIWDWDATEGSNTHIIAPIFSVQKLAGKRRNADTWIANLPISLLTDKVNVDGDKNIKDMDKSGPHLYKVVIYSWSSLNR